jgi:hypothetical protein
MIHTKITTTTGNNGRLGNQIIRNLAVSLIAEKYNLKVNYSNKDVIEKLGIKLFSGINVYNKTEILNDSNYFSIYNCNNLNYNLDPNHNYFQTNEITNFLYVYLNNNIKSNIIQKNIFKSRYNTNNDIFVHVRLSDVSHLNPGIYYYVKTIGSLKSNFDNLYISTDSETHSIIKTLLQHPKSKLIKYDEINTIQFASTCKHIILSHGSFSAVIGYLSFFSNVYYPKYEKNKIWYGDMFSINNWIKCNF